MSIITLSLEFNDINEELPADGQRCIVICDYVGRKYLGETTFSMTKHKEFAAEKEKPEKDQRLHRGGNFHSGFFMNSVTHWRKDDL